MKRSHGEVQGSESRHYELIRAATIWLIDVVQRAALKVRNLQKSHTKKPTKPTEWTIRRPSVGQKIGNNMPCTRRKARGSDAIEYTAYCSQFFGLQMAYESSTLSVLSVSWCDFSVSCVLSTRLFVRHLLAGRGLEGNPPSG